MLDYKTKAVFAKNLTKLLASRNITQYELASMMGVAASSVSAWCTGEKMPRMDKIEWIANYFNIRKSDLLEESILSGNIKPLPPMRKIPLIGTIACGEPILAEENISDYVDIPGHIRADFALICKGDSMINSGIRDGDIVYIRQQETVENGQIAAVIIDDEEATLKRFFMVDGHISLNAENPDYAPIMFFGEESKEIRILGLAVAYTHIL